MQSMNTQHNEQQTIYHILFKLAWEQAKAQKCYTPESLETVGFIHCSTLEQVLGSAQGFFKGQDGLTLLTIDSSLVEHAIRFEDLTGEGIHFPHIYGPLNLDAVVGAAPLPKNATGDFILPEGAKHPVSPGLVASDHLTRLPYPLPGVVFRGSLPYSDLFDPQGQTLDEFISAGVQVVVMLTPKDEVRELTGLNLWEVYQALGFEVIYVPVQDFWIPDQGAFQEPIKQTLQAARAGKTIVIHCHAGIGRTGTFAACLAKTVFDMDGPAAIDWVRQHIRGAVQTVEQIIYVDEFELLD